MSIDPKQLALPDGLRPVRKKVLIKASAPDKAPRKLIKGRFLRGPISLAWLIKASQQPGRALTVAIAVLFLVGVNRSGTVKLSNKLLREFGVDRYSKSRALKQLSYAGLITVTQAKGCSPIVTVLECSDVS
jgi:hypothetical protein